MYKQDAIKFFGTKTAIAKTLGIAQSSVSVWGELVPEKNAMKLQIASGGALKYDPAAYEKRKAKNQGKLSHDNQSPAR
ncbi:Cro/CI family transcriptional regulator [Klebsiella pneumoniae]|uniref:Cro/CI family transcriptional regulator n=1 Tax=Klebsiella pneumoniae TaxID=573 RepID=UPI00125C045C|nr:DNA-binding transcriptional regulator DicC [Klebsiella pneumoniae]HBW3346619.1 transcriptional regulator [Klebsiella pneumoniae]